MRHRNRLLIAGIMLMLSGIGACDSQEVKACKAECDEMVNLVSAVDGSSSASDVGSMCRSLCSDRDGKCSYNGEVSGAACAAKALMCVQKGSDCN